MSDTNGHARWRTLLERHLDGDLDAAGRQELFEHLELCEECQETLEAEERLIDRLSRLPRLAAPSDLRAAILREAARERTEALQPVTEDARYAELFSGPTGREDGRLESAGEGDPRKRAQKVRRVARTGSGGGWRAASPSLAIAFLVMVAGGRVLVELPLESLWSKGAAVASDIVSAEAGSRSVASFVPMEKLAPADATQLTTSMKDAGHASLAESGSRAILTVNRGLDRMRTGIAGLAAAAGALPLPAEQARPISQVLVLRLTESDRGAAGESGRRLSNLLQASLEARRGLGTRILSFQQWERGGHRYRSFTVDLPEAECSALIDCLNGSCSALADFERGDGALPGDGLESATREMAAFSGGYDQYKTAFRRVSPPADATARTTRLCFVLPND